MVKAGNKGTPTAQPQTDPELYPGDATQGDAWRRVLSLGLTGLGIGAGAASLVGLKDLIAKGFKQRNQQVRPSVIAVNVPTSEDEEEASPLRFRRKLAANGTPPTLSQWLGNIVKAPVRAFRDWWKTPSKPDFMDLLTGRLNEETTSKPWFWPAAIGALGLGLYGGYSGINKFISANRKRDREQELEDAKDEYRRALVEQYSPDSVKSGAAQDELGRDLSELFQLYKQAGSIWSLTAPIAGPALGWYLALAGLLATGSGAAAYAWAKGRSPEERLAKAIKQRERLRWASSPPEIYAVANPSPVRVVANEQGQSGTVTPSTAQDEDIVNKVAQAADIAAFYKP